MALLLWRDLQTYCIKNVKERKAAYLRITGLSRPHQLSCAAWTFITLTAAALFRNVRNGLA
jgi:hypothetical protein